MPLFHPGGNTKQLSYFHPDLDRHKAECILLQNGKDGTFLLRTSSNKDEYVVSVRAGTAVKHFLLVWRGKEFQFGHGTYETVDEIVYHFSNRPLLGGNSGQTIVLVETYPRYVPEPQIYDCVRVHAEDVSGVPIAARTESEFTVNSKDGYLTRLGEIFKTWKTRWFVLHNHELKYYKNSSTRDPLRVLDLNECSECEMDNAENIKDTKHVFSLKFDWRVFYLFASSEEDSLEWVRHIQWRLNAQKRDVRSEKET